MSRPRRSFWGTTAIGEIFKFLGRSFFRSDHNMMREKPASTWYWMSSCTRAMLLGSMALLCGPRVTACSMTSHSQSGPQSTGTPSVPHSFRVGKNGWPAAKGCGCIRLRRVVPWALLLGWLALSRSRDLGTQILGSSRGGLLSVLDSSVLDAAGAVRKMGLASVRSFGGAAAGRVTAGAGMKMLSGGLA